MEERRGVTVAVRVRPMCASELSSGAHPCLTLTPTSVTLGPVHIPFSHVFTADDTQDVVYDAAVAPLLERFLQGFNCTVLAYGQTGAGKTHTMGFRGGGDGVAQRVIEGVFAHGGQQQQQQILVRVGFVEVHNEIIRDLINPEVSSGKGGLAIRETGGAAGIAIVGASEEVVRDPAEALAWLERGALLRTTAGTMMNAEASRSHSIFTITLEQRILGAGDAEPQFVQSKFHLVDLAGSERAKRTGATGARFQESKSINAGLLALGNVIRALTDNQGKGPGGGGLAHVPYRHSKLTRLLQDSLGGTAHTLMIACVSPADSSFEETLSTLKYAARTQNIKNTPVVHKDSRSVQLSMMQGEIASLQSELQRLRAAAGVGAELGGNSGAGASMISHHPGGNNHSSQSHSHNYSSIMPMDESEPILSVSSTRATISFLEKKVKEVEEDLEEAQSAGRELCEHVFTLLSDRDLRVVNLDRIAGKVAAVTNDIAQIAAQARLQGDLSDRLHRALGVLDSLHTAVVDVGGGGGGGGGAEVIGHELLERLKDRLYPSGLPGSARAASSASHHSSHANNSSTTVSSRRSASPQRKGAAASSPDDKELRQAIAGLRSELAAREAELAQAKEDLLNDEDIFAEKLAEIKAAKRENKRLLKELESAKRRSPEVAAVAVQIQTDLAGASAAAAALASAPSSARFVPPSTRTSHSSGLSHRDRVAAELEDMDAVVQYTEEDSIMTSWHNNHGSSGSKLSQQQHQNPQHHQNEIDSLKTLVADKEREITALQLQLKIQQAQLLASASHLSMVGDTLLDDNDDQEEGGEGAGESSMASVVSEVAELDRSVMRAQLQLIKAKNGGKAAPAAATAAAAAAAVAVAAPGPTPAELEALKRELEAVKAEMARRLAAKDGEIALAKTRLDEQSQLLETQIALVARQREAGARLEAELEKRAKLVEDLQAQYRAKDGLELKRMRQSQQFTGELARVTKQIAELDGEIGERRKHVEATPAKERTAQLDRLEAELGELDLRRARAVREKLDLEERFRRAFVLPREDEDKLLALEERIEALEAETAYKTAAIRELEAKLKEDNPGEAIRRLIDGVTTLAEAQTLLRKFFDRIVTFKDAEMAFEETLRKTEALLAERTRANTELEQSLRLTQTESERKMLRVRKEAELQIASLRRELDFSGKSKPVYNGSEQEAIANLNRDLRVKDEQIQVLEKECFYYKQSSRELKRKIREIAGDQGLQLSPERGQNVVRLSSKDLRAVDPAELELRKSLAALRPSTAH